MSANASGTGNLTIAAPNTNTNRTLTLPDATGTFNTSGAVNEVPAGSASAPSIYPTGDSNTGEFFPAADTIAWTTGGTECGRFNSSGNLQTLGTISVGNATPSTSGAGITFPATQSASTNANTLDDYEEGTWTPTVRGEISAGTTTYTTQLGYYTKIGNIVHLFCSVAYSAATGTGTLQIKGTPFNNVDRVTMGAVRVQDLDWNGTPTYLVATFQDTSGTIVLNGSSDNASVTENSLSNESAGIIFQITYRV